MDLSVAVRVGRVAGSSPRNITFIGSPSYNLRALYA